VLRQREELAALEARLMALPAAPKPKSAPDARSPSAGVAGLAPEAAKGLLAALLPLEKRLQSLSTLCEAEPGLAQVNAVAHHYGRTAARELPVFEQALGTAGLTLELPLPPLVVPMERAQLMESWEEATEQCLHRLSALREALDASIADRALEAQRGLLLAQLEMLKPGDGEALPEVPEHEELSRRLFERAVSVREAWAKLHVDELSGALELALQTLDQERSLRPLFRNEPSAASWLCRLFGIWGSTLLSLGNCFSPEADTLERLVIDEAGQCHPAHAVAALMRAESALVIGDVHQLTPVIALGPDDEERLLRSCRLRTPAARLVDHRVHAEAQVSAQSLADRAVLARLSLVDHFRCQPEIIALSDALCGYGLSVHTPRASRADRASFLTHPVGIVDVRGVQERLAGSLCNEAELEQCLTMLEALMRAGLGPHEIAVITPYRGQLERLRRGCAERQVPLEYSPELGEFDGPRGSARAGVALGTVHRFQGGERSVVLFSSVVTQVASLAFLNARPNLLNVALSRAQHHFVCLGDRAVLAQGPRTRLLTSAASPLPPVWPSPRPARVPG
jgi:hypothetical protein